METDATRRDVLPVPDRAPSGLITYDAKDPDTPRTRIEPIRPPRDAPNVLVVLLDDVGFGASSAFGGVIATPHAERLAAAGLKYNRFHTTALCSPTRAALLSGRNHHTVGMGGITEIATSAPGYDSRRPNTCAPLAEASTSVRSRRGDVSAARTVGARPDAGSREGAEEVMWGFRSVRPGTGCGRPKILVRTVRGNVLESPCP